MELSAKNEIMSSGTYIDLRLQRPGKRRTCIRSCICWLEKHNSQDGQSLLPYWKGEILSLFLRTCMYSLAVDRRCPVMPHIAIRLAYSYSVFIIVFCSWRIERCSNTLSSICCVRDKVQLDYHYYKSANRFAHYFTWYVRLNRHKYHCSWIWGEFFWWRAYSICKR